jgi:starch synthase
MICEAAEDVIRRANGKINILVGGMGTPSDPYVAACINKINYLRGRYPNSFWADPNEFFTDGPKINLGSDFGLMPSLFEPGGIVQQEFFVAGTPVIAFRTGGLRDTVFEYNWDNNTGNGFTFDYYNPGELINAMNRAMNLFQNKEAYEQCRKNAYASTIDVSQVSRAWCREFYRLKGKIFFNVQEVLDSKKDIDHSGFSDAVEALKESPSEYIFQKKETEEFAAKQAKLLSNKNFKAYTIAPSSIINDGEIRIPVTFTYNVDEKHPPQSVQICGSFDKWQVRHPLSYDTMKNQWVITLKVKKGKYTYKYVVDGNWVINDKEPTMKESNGIVNNVLNL